MKNLLITVALFGVLAMSGCATLSESQCIASDWQTVGFRDGVSGTQSSQLLKHQNACVKHGIVPDRQAYLAGWDDGVEQYCQPRNGFAAGERYACTTLTNFRFFGPFASNFTVPSTLANSV